MAREARPVREALSADHRAKLDAWQRQHQALQSPAYRLTLTSRRPELATYNMGKGKGEGGGERTYTAAEVEGLIPQLRRQNARGYDVYITPIDPRHHYIVVDDMRDDGRALRAAGWNPCLVQSSSPKNWQAIIKAPRTERVDEQQIANSLVQQLNQAHGDPGFSGVVHPFRMAGFSNKKPGKGGAFTRLLHTAGAMCRKAAEWLRRRRDELDAAALKEAEERARKVAQLADEIDQAQARTPAKHGRAWPPSQVFAEELAEVQELVRARGWEPNASAIDWQVCLRMLRAGWQSDEVEDALLQGSPDLAARHHSPMDYCRRTVGKASLQVATERVKTAHEAPAEARHRRPAPGRGEGDA